MIEYYSFGSMTISGKRYTSDLKIINGQVHPEWWRKKGHSVAVDEVTDILNAKPDYLIIGSGKFGLMKISAQLRRHLSDCGIEVIVERSKTAMKTYNQMYADGKNIAGGFHLRECKIITWPFSFVCVSTMEWKLKRKFENGMQILSGP